MTSWLLDLQMTRVILVFGKHLQVRQMLQREC